MRTLVVDGVRYRWLARGTEHGIAVRIATDEAFVHGQHGQWLELLVPYDSLEVAHASGWSVHQRAVVAPGLVRCAIEVGRRADPPFTGRDGEPDMQLDYEDVRRALGETPLVRTRADLVRAEALLGKMVAATEEPDRLVGVTAVLLGYFFAIGCRRELTPDPGVDAAIHAWCQRNAAAVERIVPHVQAASRAIEEMLGTPWPSWDNGYRRCCERRSALAFFVDLARGGGLGETVARIDTEALDARMRERPPTDFAPPGVPRSHAWWGVRLPFGPG